MTKKHMVWAAEFIQKQVLDEDKGAVRAFCIEMFRTFNPAFDEERFREKIGPLFPLKK